MTNKLNTDVANAKWHTLWKKRMESGKPREGDYNFVVWKKGSEIIVDPFDTSLPPSIFKEGVWEPLADKYPS